jgi:hypothetical protein
MDRTCTGDTINVHKTCVRKLQGKEALAKTSIDNIKMELTKNGCKDVNWM